MRTSTDKTIKAFKYIPIRNYITYPIKPTKAKEGDSDE